MIRKSFNAIMFIVAVIDAPLIANASQLVEGKVENKLVPSPVDYNALRVWKHRLIFTRGCLK